MPRYSRNEISLLFDVLCTAEATEFFFYSSKGNHKRLLVNFFNPSFSFCDDTRTAESHLVVFEASYESFFFCCCCLFGGDFVFRSLYRSEPLPRAGEVSREWQDDLSLERAARGRTGHTGGLPITKLHSHRRLT
eukprot:gene6324-4552_t